MYTRFAVLLSLAVAGCGSPAAPGGGSPDPDPSSDRVAREVVSPEGDIGVVVGGHNAFSWDLYGALAADAGDQNVFFSPFSVTAALGMTEAGANGVTEAEMQAVLHLSGDEGRWHEALGALTRDLNGDLGRGYTLNIANKLFGQTDYPWREDFLAVCADHYGAPLESWDFLSDPEGGRQLVNDWVLDNTAQRIDELLPPGSVTSDTRLVLADAIYFQAGWALAFDPEDTRDADFHRPDGSTVSVPMMTMELELVEDHGIESAWTEDATILKLPYQDDEISMVVVLPHEVDGLAAVEAELSAETWAEWISSLSPASQLIGLPRLEIRYDNDLVPFLDDLGMPSAFTSAADLTGLADPGDGLYISGVFHQAFVKIDESGTEAAAASAVVVNDEAGYEPIFADHPFLFVIQDDLTGAILFVGRVTDPS